MIDRKKHLIVEGWRFIPHSFAIVNQAHILALLRRGDVALELIDAPYFSSQWKAQTGLIDDAAEARLRAVRIAAPDAAADVTLRMTYPFDFSLSRSNITAVVATAEGQVLLRESFGTAPDLDRVRGNPRFRIVTPSTWCAQAFLRLGFAPDQIAVVPHGTDVTIFRPPTAPITALRASLGLTADDLVFLNVSAMASNKGIDLLLKAFAATHAAHPQARLVLKGTEAIFASKDLLLSRLQTLPAADRERVIAHSRYIGGSWSDRDMARLYQAADAYVSPYRAEGFNIPVLEAAACGLPLIVTRGGSTDDFVTDAFARRIRSTISLRDRSSVKYVTREPGAEAGLTMLEPDLDHLIAEMDAVIGDEAWRRAASAAAAAHVRAHYGWDQVVEVLVNSLWN